VSYFNRYFVTEGKTSDVVLKTSNKVSELKDFIYGNADQRGAKHFKLWDQRLADGDGPALIDEAKQRT